MRRFLGLSPLELVVPLTLLVPIIIAALFAGFLTPYPPLGTAGPPLALPSTQHPLGTDQIGGDVFSQVVYGSRAALFVSIGSTVVALIIGILFGMPAGYFGGLPDDILMRITDVVLSIPSFILVLFVVILFGSRLDVITLVIAAVSWPTLARIARAEVLTLREREFALAAKAIGAGPVNLMFDEILPNIWSPLLPAITLQMGSALLTEVGLSFLGLGDPNISSWGRTIFLGSTAVYAGAWWLVIPPGIAVIVTILGFNILGQALGRAFNPREGRS